MIYKLRKIEGVDGRWGWDFLFSDRFVILIEAKMMKAVICSIGFLRSFVAMSFKWNFVTGWVGLGWVGLG